MATLRPGMLHAAQPDFARTTDIIPLPTDHIAEQIRTTIVERTYWDTGVSKLESASIILDVGMGAPEAYAPLHRLAHVLHAAIVGDVHELLPILIARLEEIGFANHLSPSDSAG